MRIKEIAHTRVRYGYRRIHTMLCREGWTINHKRVYRLYKKEGLQMRNKIPKRRVALKVRSLPTLAVSKNECWSMDFVSDELFNGQKIRALTIVDNCTRESPFIKVETRMKGLDVAQALDQAIRTHGKPKTIKVDNGPEFISKELDLWAYVNKIALDYSRPGKPTDNAFIESFNSRFRQECLNQDWFMSLEDAKDKVEKWRIEYNLERPHSALGYKTPSEFAAHLAG